MYTALLHLHNILRWAILILLILCIVKSFSAKKDGPMNGLEKTSLFLLIAAHLTLLLGLFQWFAGDMGLKMIQNFGMTELMKNSAARFWAIEHITGMIVAVILITLGRRKVKTLKFKAAAWLYTIALLIILASIPWPFREGIGRPWI
jgi:hypothetical protein